MKRERRQDGTVFLDKRIGVWYFQFYREGHRKQRPIGSLSDYPTKTKAIKAAVDAGFREQINSEVRVRQKDHTFATIAQRYMIEWMPPRHGGYTNWLNNHVIPKWGDLLLEEIEPLQVYHWIKDLRHAEDSPRWKKGDPLAGKTKAHIKGAMRQVFEFAMLAGLFPIQRNPMELVKVEGASKRTRKLRILTYEEWTSFIANVTKEPQRTAIITCMCLGIRREEIWALKWMDFDFNVGTVMMERVIVGGEVHDKLKTEASEAPLPLDPALVALLLAWRDRSEFNKDSDWVWASPHVAGEMPLYFNAVQRDYIIPAAVKAGLGKIGWHCFRHTYRSWLNAAGTPLGVQKDLMRHSNISMTTGYGAGVDSAMREFNSRVVKRAIQ